MEITKEDIIEAIRACLNVSPLIKPSKTLINTIYVILEAIYIKNHNYIVLEAPTGSGKTIIGFITYFCMNYIEAKSNGDSSVADGRMSPIQAHAYFLTSSKLLQEQIDKDLERFNFRDYITMLKGTTNYACTEETNKIKPPYQKDKKGNEIKMISYADRPCKGLSAKALEIEYPNCFDLCPYKLARAEAAQASCAVLNYAYFLNVNRSEFGMFGARKLTIADEAHLIPEIVQNTFNFELTQYLTNQLFKLINEVEMLSKTTTSIHECKELILKNFSIFKTPLNDVFQILSYFNNIDAIRELLVTIKSESKLEGYKEKFVKIIDECNEALQYKEMFELLVGKRLKDVYYESEIIAKDDKVGIKIYKHVIKDLDEATMVRRHFLSKTDVCIFMSATLGDIDEYAKLMGIDENEYTGFRLPTTFDFSKSPIIIAKSAWLNYANFESNIDKVIMDTLKICTELHPKEKGIIHTSTFVIGNKLKEKINMGLVPDRSRFLFYQTADEKEEMINLMKNSNKPYVIVGPSLYEGLDLKDDLGRFNILIKAPYAAMNNYIKRKMERFPFWYERNTLEKIVQAIGRTNRHTNDYSTVYLMDSCFDKLIFKTNESIINRLIYKTIY